MFKVDLDHALYFVPPMDEHAGGIIVTRTLELPFAPSPGLMVFGKEMDECPEPMGFKLGDLVWDMDRQVFLAKTSTVYDSPIALVPYEIRGWIDRGWRFGSYLDLYPQEDEPKTRSKMLKELVARDGVPDFDDDEMDRWPALPPAARPGHFNETFGSLVRMMADSITIRLSPTRWTRPSVFTAKRISRRAIRQ